MTEVERIIKEGLLPESFFQEEVICDYVVTEQLKKVWAVGLDLLLKLDKVCKKYNFRYFLAHGTLLGAVRHKGFIPWDDDIDVLMPREDYDKFCKLSSEFSDPYFLQTPETDKGYLYSCIRIRNSNTCNFFDQRQYWGWNGGVFLDIFPLDNCIKEDCEEIFQEIDMLNGFNSAFMKIPSPYLNEKGKKLLVNHLDLSPLRAIQLITELSTKYSDVDTPYVTNYVATVYRWDKMLWNAVDFLTSVDLEFCGYKFPAPIGYHSVLTTNYGDYMCMPPIEERGAWHSGHIIDPDRSYTDIFKEMGIHRY